jgi:hypothetical protein
MSSTSVSVPTYRHHKGSGQAFGQVQGRRHYLGKWDLPQSKEHYSRFVAEMTVSLMPAAVLPLTTPVSEITVVELAAASLDFADEYYRKNGKPTTHLPQLKAAIRLVHQLYGAVLAAEFGPLALRAIQQKMVATGASRRYTNQHTGPINRMFQWAVSVRDVAAVRSPGPCHGSRRHRLNLRNRYFLFQLRQRQPPRTGNDS